MLISTRVLLPAFIAVAAVVGIPAAAGGEGQPPQQTTQAPAPAVTPDPCPVRFSQREHRVYVRAVYRRAHVSSRARRQIRLMHRCSFSPKATRNMRVVVRGQKRTRRARMCSQRNVIQCIRDAADRWHVSFAMLLRKGRCESELNPYSRNGSSTASGLFQFLYPSTWNTTPYRHHSVFSAKWNSLAAGYMHHVGRGGEWVCQ